MTMQVGEIFDALLENLKVGEVSVTVAARRDEITKALNKDFRSVEGSTANRLMVGSYGRHTAIRGVSDLDLIYVLPASLRSKYDGRSGPRQMLNRVRDDLKGRYPNTQIVVDQCVVRVQFASNKFKFEVQPAFVNIDGSFAYPDTKSESWNVTKPREEISATKDRNDRTSRNMRHLARMARAWKDVNGVVMGGLLIDTLVHRFFSTTTEYDGKSSHWFDFMARDFFKFLADEPDKDYYLALGSSQRVTVKQPFQPKARKAYHRCVEAIADEGRAAANKKWREVFGSAVPLAVAEVARDFKDTEEFIEDQLPVDISELVEIDCEVTQNGWRPRSLRMMLRDRAPLLAHKGLDFTIVRCSVAQPYDAKWKVLNRGEEAERRNNIRGQIIASSRPGVRHERTTFRGEHVVECYIVKDGIVVARDIIDVPISTSAA